MNLTEVSKFLALILRHKPEELGLTLDKEGWCNTDELVSAFATKFVGFTMETLEKIVSTDKKGRYAFNDDKTKVRAVQGHSVKGVNITFEEVDWDAMKDSLYHGTAERFVDSIKEKGLLPMSRQYVHLSSNIDTAIKVGQRHGKPVVFKIDTDKMKKLGYKLYKAENNVYLTQKVPYDCMTLQEEK